MSTRASVRCRNAQCSQYESTTHPFKKCGRCHLARYCSRECQVADWPLHKIMCTPNRVLVDGHGGTVDAAQAVAEFTANPQLNPDVSTSGAVTQTSSTENHYLEPSKYSNYDVMKLYLERLQIQTNLFYVSQYTSVKQRGFLFIQTESAVNNFRPLINSQLALHPSLARSFICYYMTLKEFTRDVVRNHPNRSLAQKPFLKRLESLLAEYNPEAEVVMVGVFGGDEFIVFKADLPPYTTLLEAIQQDPDMFDGQDCIEINIDADD